MSSKLTLNQYIENIGAANLGRRIGVSRQCVHKWYRFETYPRPYIAKQIIKNSRGKVSWESIYEPYFKKNKHGRQLDLFKE